MFPAPPAPTFPSDQAATSRVFLRYEDCTQDGRLAPIAIPPSLGGLWQSVLLRHPGTRNAFASGTIPLLTRMTVTSIEQPIRIDHEVESYAGFELAQMREQGEVSRLFMNVWSEVRGIAGRIGPRQQPGALSVAGQLFAEHTFTRPFGPPDKRRVTSFAGVDGFPELPEAHYDAPAPFTAQDAPEGGRWIDELAPDAADVVFTLDQTDANQHVNSLVYVRVFLDALQRRLAAGSHPLKVRSKAFDIAYRKPCFAGDQVRTHIRLFEHEGNIGGAGFIATPGDEAKPRCYVRVVFGP